MRNPKLDNALVVLASIGVFAGLAALGNQTAPYLWPKVIAAFTFSAACLWFVRDRDALDVFLTVIAALFTLAAAAMTAGDRTHQNWWPFFLCFTAIAAVCVLLTRNKRAALLAIAAIVGSRLLFYVFRSPI